MTRIVRPATLPVRIVTGTTAAGWATVSLVQPRVSAYTGLPAVRVDDLRGWIAPASPLIRP